MSNLEQIPEIELRLVWKPVRLAGGVPFDWHLEPARYARDRDQLSGPKVYRWLLKNADGGLDSCYIGQSLEFEQRLAEYRSGRFGRAGTERLVREEMRRCEERGGTVELEFLDLASGQFSLNGWLINTYELGNLDVRLMMESIATIGARTQNIKVINRLGQNAYEMKIISLVNEIARTQGVTRTMEILESLLHTS
jgi:hypothetical protein